PATGPAPAGCQRRALPRAPPQRLPGRRRRVPGHHPRDDHPRPRRHHHLHTQEHRRHPGPARPGSRHTRPRPAPRRDQHPAASATRRRTAHHLHPPTITVIALSRPLIAGDLGLSVLRRAENVILTRTLFGRVTVQVGKKQHILKRRPTKEEWTAARTRQQSEPVLVLSTTDRNLWQ